MTHMEFVSLRSRMLNQSRVIRKMRPLMEFTYRCCASCLRRETVSVDYQRVASANVTGLTPMIKRVMQWIKIAELSSVTWRLESIPRDHNRRFVAATSPTFARFNQIHALRIAKKEEIRRRCNASQKYPDGTLRNFSCFRSPHSSFALFIDLSSRTVSVQCLLLWKWSEKVEHDEVIRKEKKESECYLDAFYSSRLSVLLYFRKVMH